MNKLSYSLQLKRNIRKIAPVPIGWQQQLLMLGIDEELVMRNEDNAANRGRSAIKTFYKRHPLAQFETSTCRKRHEFCIKRIK